MRNNVLLVRMYTIIVTFYFFLFCSSRRRHTRCALVTGVQTCALPISIAVLIVPRKPSDQFGGYAELSTGNYDMQREQAVINLPITDYFKLRFGIDHQARDGYVRNVTGIGADDLNDVDYTAGRLSMVLNLTDAIENYTILSYVHSKTNGNKNGRAH